MTKPSIYIGHPEQWIAKRPWLHTDNEALYDTLVPMAKKIANVTVGRIKHIPNGFDIILAHHTNSDQTNVWNLKKGYLPGFMYWDRTGYSGWADIAKSVDLFKESQRVDIVKAESFFNTFAQTYIKNGTSKFPQDGSGQIKNQTDLSEFKVDGPYVFVALQRPRDTVSQLARISTDDLALKIVKLFRGTEYKVVIKRHPQEKLLDMTKISSEKHVIMSQHSIHKIIPGADAVFTVNSGVGFEALLYKKPVYTSGECDYHWVTRCLTDQSIKLVPQYMKQPVDTNVIVKFMYYMLNEYFVNAHDPRSIERKLRMVIQEWERKQ